MHNWWYLDPSEFSVVRKSIEGLEEDFDLPVPLPTQFGGTVEVDFTVQKKADHGHNMMEFDIKTSTEAAML